MTRCAVVGSPIAHSLSPVLHRAAYAGLGLDWTYEAVELGSADLAGFLAGLDADWRGLSLTMPLKRTLVPLLDDASERTRLTGAANTLVLDGGRRVGHNTDVPGAAVALRSRYDGPLRRAVVLGGGATATSVVHALADLGCAEVVLVVRSPERAAETVASAARHPAAPRVAVHRLGEGPVSGDLLVSTIPAGAQDAAVLAMVEPVAAVFEVVYDPWPTPLAAHAQATGRVLVSGLDLLVAQAALQVRLMTGHHEVPVAAMRAAGEAELSRRQAFPGR